MSPLPRALHRALHRARLWTAGALTASTLLVGAIGVHLAEAHTQTVAASTSGTTGSNSSSSSDTSSSATSSSDASGFSAVSPVENSNDQAQTSSGGS
jgi:hypothetical protein